MSTLLAIDPGPVASGWALIDTETCEPIDFDKALNEDVLGMWRRGDIALADSPVGTVIEMVASYGMAVGKDVFQTCVWIGRFQQHALTGTDLLPQLIYRRDVKLHHCGQTKAKDSNIRQALVDRFAPGQPNHGKGTKASPGWFHGFRADIWQAYALAVLAADRTHGRAGAAS